MEDNISDNTMANLPSRLMSDESQDLFDVTMITSTQNVVSSDATVRDIALSPIKPSIPIASGSTAKKSNTCMEDCKYIGKKPGKDKEDLVQCHLCQHWAHPSCVGEKTKDIVGIWTCCSCRTTPDVIRIMCDLLANIQQENVDLKNHITTKLVDMKNTIEKRDGHMVKFAEALTAKTNEHVTAMKEIADLRSKVTELNAKLDEQSWKRFRPHSKGKSLLVGSSIIRDVSESRLDKTDVTCVPGGLISDVTNAVSKRPSDTYERIILVTGGNDCARKEAATQPTASSIVEQYRTLVQLSKQKSRNVTVSSVCPRISSAEVKAQIDSVNAGLQVMCDVEGATYVDNTPFFHLAEGSVNDAYYLDDGVHLTYKATNTLAKNLKLMTKDGLNGVCETRRHHETRTKPRKPAPKPSDDVHSSNLDITDDQVDTSHAFSTHATRKYQNTEDFTSPFWSRAHKKASGLRGRRMNDEKHRQKSARENQRHSYHNKDDSYNYSETLNNETRCYNCYESNHVVRNCNHDKPVTCFQCKQSGHKAKHHTSNNY